MSYSRADEGSYSRDPIEGELSCPRSPANETEPCLAYPRKCFHGHVFGPRTNPYRTGHGRPLESPNNSSTRNPRFATRSMGVVGASPLCPAKGRRRGVRTRWRARPDRLKWARARGLDARLHLLDMHRTQTRVNTCTWHRRGRLKHCRRRLKLTPRTPTNFVKKTLQEHPRSCKASGATAVGALAPPTRRHSNQEGRTSHQQASASTGP
jgi:hypothetical protein